jgi:tetratricopeptide (TPR) repeat protein
MRDYFDILQVPEDATDQAILQAYKRMKKKYPIRQYPEISRDIEEAYRVLCDPVAKASCLEFHRMEPESKRVYRDAQQSIIVNEPGNAVKMLKKALDSEQHKDHLYYLLGIAYMNEEKPHKAVKALEQIVEKYPDDIHLKIYFSKACLDAKLYKKAIENARIGYEALKDNILAVYCLVEGYIRTKKYGAAADVLEEAFGNPEFKDYRFNICTKLAYVLFLKGRYEESLLCMEKLIDEDVDEDEILESGTMFLEMLDFYIDKHMFTEAGRCTDIILKLLPEGRDHDGLKDNIKTILMLEPEYSKFDKDGFIPNGLKNLIANEIFMNSPAYLTDEQMKAFEIMNEYQILNDSSSYLMALRYMKNKYPVLYELKADFLNAVQVAKERKKLINKNKALFYQYQHVIEDLIEKWGGDYQEESEDEYRNYGDDDGDNGD